MYHLKQNNLLIIILLTLILLQSRSLLKEVKAISLRKHTSVRHESKNQLTTTTAATTLNKLETTQQLNITQISTNSYSIVQLERNQFAIYYIDIPADKVVSLYYYCSLCKGALNLYTKFNSVPTLSDRGKYLSTATPKTQTNTIKRGSSYNDNSVVRLYVFVLNTSPVFLERFFVIAEFFDDIPDNIGIIIAFSILTPVLIIVVLALIIVVYIKRKSWLQNEQYTSIFNNNNKYNHFNHSQNNPSSLIQNTTGSSSGGDGYGYGATVNIVGNNNNQQQTTMDTIQQQSYQQQSKSDNEKK
ncbi:hypothetical protein ABK040_014001 [Willaertia magna]